MPVELTTRLRELLLAGRNPDGGWGYYVGKHSRLEPTCWALLSHLQEGRPEDAPIVEAGLNRVATWQRADGLISEPSLPANLAFNGLASLLLAAARGSALAQERWNTVGARLDAAIVGVKSRTTWNWLSPARQDNSLIGWPWTEETFAWVEPTALCALALAKSTLARTRTAGGRIQAAQTLLLDRRCAEGGWNYGNAEVLGQSLRAYVPPTALALLALQDMRDRPQVRQGMEYLLQAWPREASGMACGLALLCIRVNDAPGEALEAGLARAHERDAFLGNLSVTGLVRYALTAGTHGASAFRT